jgi:hypothetical protein
LQNRIYEATKNTLAEIDPKIDACDLTLYHVEISDLDNLEKAKAGIETAVKQKLSENPTKLDPLEELADAFKDGLKEETIHIIVQPPKSGK